MILFSTLIADPREDIAAHLPSLRAFAVSLTRNRASADDLVQDTIVKAWTNIAKFSPGSNLRAWLFTILRNTFYSNLRKSRREVRDAEGIFAARLCVKPDHDGVLAMREFMVVFNTLSPEHREALTLVGALGFSYQEAAETARVAVGTMKSRVSRARQILGDRLGLPGGECNLSSPDTVISGVISRAEEHAGSLA